MTHTETLPQKINKKEIGAIKSDQNTTVVLNSASTGDSQVSDIATNSDHILKESQDLNLVALNSISSNKKIKSLDAEKESFEDSVTVDKNDFDNDFFNDD